jgi:hypothetical protein
MGNLFNFNKNIREIIKPKLKEIGFKNKGNHFYKEINGFNVEVFIFGSGWNNSQFNIQEFFIDLNISGNGLYNSIRIPNKPLTNKPNRYNDYYKEELFEMDWNKRDNAFNEEETKNIHDYCKKLRWKYKDENELKNILNIASNILIDYGIKYFEYIENNIDYLSKNKTEIDNIYNKIFVWG